MSTPTAIGQRFRREVRAKMLQLLNHQHLSHISREAVETVGKNRAYPQAKLRTSSYALREWCGKGRPAALTIRSTHGMWRNWTSPGFGEEGIRPTPETTEPRPASFLEVIMAFLLAGPPRSHENGGGLVAWPTKSSAYKDWCRQEARREEV
jgi:hypothetical protein